MKLLLQAKVDINIDLDYDPFNKYETGPDKPYLKLDSFVLKESNEKSKFGSDYLELIMHPQSYYSYNEGYIEMFFVCTTNYDLNTFDYNYILKYSKNTINKLLKIKIKSAFKTDKFSLDIKLGYGFINLNEIDVKYFNSSNEKVSFRIDNALLYSNNLTKLNKLHNAFDSIMKKFKNEINII